LLEGDLLRVCFISGREPQYVRNAVLLKAMRGTGIDVLECTDCSKSYLTRHVQVLRKFLSLRREDFDLVFVGFLGQILVPIIRKLTRRPMVFDAYLSVYDTMCFDRKKFAPDSLAGRFFYWLDRRSCAIADKVLLDTEAHIDYFVSTFGLESRKFQRVFVGVDEAVFYPRDTGRECGRFRVLYYSTYLPLHGVEHIIHAAEKLERHADVEFQLIGRGQQLKEIRRLAGKSNATNVRFLDWVAYADLPSMIAEADVCLVGHFSDIDKARRVIPGKAFQCTAMRKPVIVADNPANRELFQDRENARFVEMASADSLADAIMELKDDDSLRERIAAGGYRTMERRCTTGVIGKEVRDLMVAMLGEPQ